MKKGFKRGVSLFAVGLMLISMVPINVFAEQVDVSKEVDFNQESMDTKSVEPVTSDPENLTSNEPTQTTDYEIVDGVLVGYYGEGGDVVIPDDLGLTTIGDSAFDGCTSLTSVTIPKG